MRGTKKFAMQPLTNLEQKPISLVFALMYEIFNCIPKTFNRLFTFKIKLTLT